MDQRLHLSFFVALAALALVFVYGVAKPHAALRLPAPIQAPVAATAASVWGTLDPTIPFGQPAKAHGAL